MNNVINETPDAKPKSSNKEIYKSKTKKHDQQYIHKNIHKKF